MPEAQERLAVPGAGPRRELPARLHGLPRGAGGQTHHGDGP